MQIIKTTLLAISLSLLFISCGGDEDDNNMNLTGLEGEWTAIEFSATTTTNSAGQVINAQIEATTLDYCLTLQDGEFQTNGSYILSTDATTSGIAIPTQTSNFDNVEGSGTYTDNGTSLEIDGSFFEIDVNGMSITEVSNGPQTAEYSIDGNGNLIIVQNESISEVVQGIMLTVDVQSSSTWERK